MEYCALGQQYLGGATFGFIVGLVCSDVFYDLINRGLNILASTSVEDSVPRETGEEGSVARDMTRGAHAEENETNPDVSDPNVSDPADGLERLFEQIESPNKNTFIFRLTDTALNSLWKNITLPTGDINCNNVGADESNNTTEQEYSTTQNEYANIFDQEVMNMDAQDARQTKDLPLDLPPPPLNQHRTDTPKYARLGDLGKTPNVKEYLPSYEERSIIRKYSSDPDFCILNLPYSLACEKASRENYNLHILYRGLGQKTPLPEYSSTTIGVRVKSFDYDPNEPYVTEIIDVGGVDLKDRGVIKL